MYDDLLGKPKKKKNKITKITLTGSTIKALNFKVDERTLNGHIYMRKDMDKALDYIINKSNLWLVSKISKNDPTIVNPSDIIGRCLSHNIDKDNNILIEISYLKGMHPYSQFDITTASLGMLDKNGIVKDLIIIQLYII